MNGHPLLLGASEPEFPARWSHARRNLKQFRESSAVQFGVANVLKIDR